jgi:hypothetical protein
MSELAKRVKDVPPSWNVNWATSSVTFTSPDRKKILKIDAEKNYTLDVKRPDGTYKSTRFNCKSVDEAWTMAFQVIKIHRSADAIH